MTYDPLGEGRVLKFASPLFPFTYVDCEVISSEPETSVLLVFSMDAFIIIASPVTLRMTSKTRELQ